MTTPGKLNILLTFGGRSREHEVSLISASNLFSHFNPEKYHINLLYISRDGHWMLCDTAKFKKNCDIPEEIIQSLSGVGVTLPVGQGDKPHLHITPRPGDPATKYNENVIADTSQNPEPRTQNLLFNIKNKEQTIPIDVVFTLLHGRHGAGGVMQGLWKTLNIPSAGPSIAGGVVGFDKDLMKRLLSQAELPVCRYTVIHRRDYTPHCLEHLKKQFGFPFFIKPANSGSSLGVHKIYKDADFKAGVQDVFSFDDKLIVEEFIDGSELEIYAFKSGDEIKTSIIRQTFVGKAHDFYTYEAKYGTDNATANIKNIPAEIPPADHEKVRQLAIEAYKKLEGRGEIRLDLFYSSRNEIYINEINTVPALMSRKSQPSLWDGCNISQGEIVDALITSALEEEHLFKETAI